MPESIKNFWDNLSSSVKLVLFFIAILTSFSSGQFIVNPRVKANGELAEANHVRLNTLTKSVEFLTRVSVATAKTAGVDTEEIRKAVDAEFRQLEALGR